MGRIPRKALVAPVLLGLLGCSSTGAHRPTAEAKADDFEKQAEHLVGRWHDPSWKEVVLTVERTGPTSFRLVEKSNDGRTRTGAGELVVVDAGAYLDVKNERARPGEPRSHQLFKLADGFMLEVSVGDRAKSKEFHHNPFKRYMILRLLPFQTTYLASHPEALRHEVRKRDGSPETNIVVTASSAEIAAFLKDHADDNGAWADEDGALVVVRR
jgi:hypothetical protein